MSMDLAVVIPRIEQHGGAEIFLMQCMQRWQRMARITLYSCFADPELMTEFGIDLSQLKTVELEELGGENRNFDLVEDMLLLPRIWEQQLAQHDAYFLNGFPTHFIQRSPSVYMCHEPLRMLYDLRYQTAVGSADGEVHIYPEQHYRSASIRRLEAQLELIESIDRQSKFDHLAVNSQAMAEYVNNVYGKQADLVAYPGINPVKVPGTPGREQRAIYVGRLWRHKRIHLLIQAIARLQTGHLDIVGSGPEESRLKSLIEELGVQDRVTMHGRLSQDEVAGMYRKATCAAYVPVREPFGMMPLEAAAAGLPAIVALEGGYSEILDATAALYVSPRPVVIARAMKKLFTDHELAEKMGLAARRQVEEITWDRTASALGELLHRAIEQGKKPEHGNEKTLLGAHYYPWYDVRRPVRHWGENSDFASLGDLPLRGAYSSADPRVIEQHLDDAQYAGLDYFAVNWEVGPGGVNRRDLEATEVLFECAGKRTDFSLCLTLSLHTALSETIEQTLDRVRKLAASPHWTTIRGKPMLWLFISQDFFGSFYANKALYESLSSQFAILATGGVSNPKHLPNDLRRFIHGWSLFIPFRVGAKHEWEEKWTESYRNHVDSGKDPYRVFTVAPGFDDNRLTSDNRLSPRVVEREKGDIYTRMLQSAMDLSPAAETIIVSSFNEYHETTHIEPGFEHGREYLEQTRVFSRNLLRNHGKTS